MYGSSRGKPILTVLVQNWSSTAETLVIVLPLFSDSCPLESSGSAASGDTCCSSSGSPKSCPNRNFAQTIQWIGSEGVFRIVQPGNVFCRGLSLKKLL